MSENMTEKYQNYYNKLLNGTLTDAIIKSISYQANIQLANDIISEQEKTIENLESKVVDSENQVKIQKELVVKLQSELNESYKLKSDFENIKHQVSHVDTFRNELVKERENHKKTRNEFEQKIKELNNQIEYLQLTPAKRKKIDEVNKSKEEIVLMVPSSEDTTKDGGSF